MENALSKIHPKGENQKLPIVQALDKVAVDTYAGCVHINWDHNHAQIEIDALGLSAQPTRA